MDGRQQRKRKLKNSKYRSRLNVDEVEDEQGGDRVSRELMKEKRKLINRKRKKEEKYLGRNYNNNNKNGDLL